MIQLNVLHYPIYEFKCDTALSIDVYNYLQTLDFRKNIDRYSNSMEIRESFFHEPLFNFFDESIAKVKQEYFSEELEFPIVDCWANRYGPLQSLGLHTHSNSIISGLFYVNEDENFGATNFSIPNPWCENFLSDSPSYMLLKLYKNSSNLKRISCDISPTVGTLLLFPAHIQHFVKPSKNTKNLRYTVSFNCFASGVFSNDNTSRLKLEAQSVRSKNGKNT